jgi:beta-N-acetylhexosaminidase
MKLKTVQEMTLKEKLGQLILPGFHSTVYDDQIKTLIEDYHVGNVILFTRNFESAEQVRALTTKIHEEVIKHTGSIPLIGIDQEGGLVTRMMKDVTFAPGPMTASASIEDATYYCGKMLAEDMIRLGMNLNLAPSLDVNNNPNNPVINVRSYSDDPKVVAKLGKRFIEGSLEFGVLACAKHFPGHGDCEVDSHLGLPTINYDLDRIHEIEMHPFKENINVPAIMSAHILFPAYDTVPATLSRKILTNVLREELGYEGLIFTDCLEMKAIQDQYGTAEGACMAVLAGADICDISHTLSFQVRALELLEEAVNDGRLPMEELDKKVERILKFKAQTLPYLEQYFYGKEMKFSEENNKLAQKIVDNSLTFQDTIITSINNQEQQQLEEIFAVKYSKIMNPSVKDLENWKNEKPEEFTSLCSNNDGFTNTVVFNFWYTKLGAVNNAQKVLLGLEPCKHGSSSAKYLFINFLKKENSKDYWNAPGPRVSTDAKNIMYPFKIGSSNYKSSTSK